MTNYLILSLLVMLQVFGSICLKRGVEKISAVNPLAFLSLIQHMFSDPLVALGAVSYAATFVLYAIAVSRMELSFVLPIAASSYALTTLCAWLILGEHVSPTRWSGTLLVSLGVIVVGLSGGNGTPRKEMHALSQRRIFRRM